MFLMMMINMIMVMMMVVVGMGMILLMIGSKFWFKSKKMQMSKRPMGLFCKNFFSRKFKFETQH